MRVCVEEIKDAQAGSIYTPTRLSLSPTSRERAALPFSAGGAHPCVVGFRGRERVTGSRAAYSAVPMLRVCVRGLYVAGGVGVSVAKGEIRLGILYACAKGREVGRKDLPFCAQASDNARKATSRSVCRGVLRVCVYIPKVYYRRRLPGGKIRCLGYFAL